MSKIILFPFWPSPKGLFVLFSVSHYFHKYRFFSMLVTKINIKYSVHSSFLICSCKFPYIFHALLGGSIFHVRASSPSCASFAQIMRMTTRNHAHDEPKPPLAAHFFENLHFEVKKSAVEKYGQNKTFSQPLPCFGVVVLPCRHVASCERPRGASIFDMRHTTYDKRR